MNFALAAAGALPALVAMAYVDRLDAARPEPRWSLRRVSIAGGVAVIPCAIIEPLMLRTVGAAAPLVQVLFTAFVAAALVEELAKLLCLRWFIWHRPEFDERMDGIVYGTRAGLGFALVENIGYLLGTQSAGGFAAMYVGRALLAVPGHAVWGGFMGYLAARKRFDGVGPGIWGGYAVAVLMHGTYDAALFSIPLAAKVNPALVLLLVAVPITVVVSGAIALRRRARLAIQLDDAAERRAREAVVVVAVVAPPGPI